jgi:hypothetical protein
MPPVPASGPPDIHRPAQQPQIAPAGQIAPDKGTITHPAPITQLPPASSAVPPAPRPAEPHAAAPAPAAPEPLQPDPAPEEAPVPRQAPPMPEEVPERPEDLPAEPAMQQLQRQQGDIGGLISRSDENSQAIADLKEHVKALSRNNLVLAGAVALLLWQSGNVLKKVIQLEADAMIEAAGDTAGELA